MSTHEPETSTELVEVQRALPVQISRFEAFLMEAKDKLEEANRGLAEAEKFVCDSEPAYQVSDQMQVSHRGRAKSYETERLELTRPIDDFKQQFVAAEKAVSSVEIMAATIYQQKMTAYRHQKRAEAEAAQRESERLLREERQRLEAEARKKEEHAARLKSEKARERLLEEAAQSRQTAAMVPESVALSAPEPVTVASNIATKRKFQGVKDPIAFHQWLSTHPEWLTCVTYKDAEMNRLARQFPEVPGVTFVTEESYRTKASRR